MEIKNIHYHTTGFLKDASYTAELLNTLCIYKDSFGEAEALTLNIEEIPPGIANWKQNKTIEFSEDGKLVTINLTSQKYTNTKGKVIGIPDVYSIYQTIHFVLKKAVTEYNIQFKEDK